MFIGKSLLASLMLSSVVMISTEVPDAHRNNEVVLVPLYPQEAAEAPQQDVVQDGGETQESGGLFGSGMEAGRRQPLEASGEAKESQAGEGASDQSQPLSGPVMEGTALAMLSSQGGSQMLSCVIRSANGRLVVIDGGWEADGDYLLETIKNNGGVVDAWLITHPHSDHVGALYHILKNRSSEIDINRIYYSFAPLSWYEEVAPEDADMVSRIMEELENLPQDKLCASVGKKDKITVDNLGITVLNDRYQLNEDPVNNSSITYMVSTKKKKILFLGDMSYEGGSCLGRENGTGLQADIVQMSHHGQNGVGKNIYETIAPKICLWATPQWLWDNDNGSGYNSGSWRTVETRGWMEGALKVEKNYSIKDGDVVLQLD